MTFQPPYPAPHSPMIHRFRLNPMRHRRLARAAARLINRLRLSLPLALVFANRKAFSLYRPSSCARAVPSVTSPSGVCIRASERPSSFGFSPRCSTHTCIRTYRYIYMRTCMCVSVDVESARRGLIRLINEDNG